MRPIKDMREHLDTKDREELESLIPEFKVCTKVLPLYGMPACRIGRADFEDIGLTICEQCPHEGCIGSARWVPPSSFRKRDE